LQRKLWLPKHLKQNQIVKLSPVEWRIRGACLGPDNPRRFREYFQRAVSEYGRAKALHALEELIKDPKHFMLPERAYDMSWYVTRIDPFRAHAARLLILIGRAFPRDRRILRLIWRLRSIDPGAAVEALAVTKRQEVLWYLRRIHAEYSRKDPDEISFCHYVLPGNTARLIAWNTREEIEQLTRTKLK